MNARSGNIALRATIGAVPRLLFLVLFVVSACTAAPPVPPTPSPSTDTCPHGVEYAVAGEEAASGLRVLTLEVTNCGTATVELDGYPSVTVTVPPGGSAVTGLLWRNTYTDTSAPPVVGEHLVLAVATGQPTQVFTPVGERGDPITLDLGSTGELGVRPWTATP